MKWGGGARSVTEGRRTRYVAPMNRPSLSGWTILFDLDGTLVESAPDIVATLNRMLVARGMSPLPYAEARKLIGGGVRPLLQKGFAQAGAAWDDAQFDSLFEAFIADYLPHIADETLAYPHVVETLDRLTARGALLAVATNKRTDLTLAMMSALDLSRYFAAIVGQEARCRPSYRNGANGRRRSGPRHHGRRQQV